MYMKSFFLALTLTCFSWGGVSAEEGAKAIYAQLSSVKSQMFTPEKRLVELEQLESVQNIEVTNKQTITIKEAGTYFLLAAAQVGAEKHGDSGFVDIWFNHNGKPVARSGSRQSISDEKLTAVLISQAILSLSPGDTLSIGFFANKSNIGLVAFPPFQNEPSIASVLFTVYRIGA